MGACYPAIAARARSSCTRQKGGERVTLYLGAIDGTGDAVARLETAFSFSNAGPVPGFYWVDQGFGYALAGGLSRENLMQLAQVIYQQL